MAVVEFESAYRGAKRERDLDTFNARTCVPHWVGVLVRYVSKMVAICRRTMYSTATTSKANPYGSVDRSWTKACFG